MKILDATRLDIILGRVSQELVELAQARLPSASGPEGWLVAGVARGDFEQALLRLDGKDIATLFFCRDNRTLIATGTVSLVTFDVGAAIETGWAKLARARGCNCIECVTIRPGGVKKLESLGYKPVGVVLRKPIL